MYRFFTKIWLAVFFTLAATTVGADEHWKFEPNLKVGSIICETKPDVEAYVRSGWNHMQQPGCGKTPIPLLVRITVEEYKIDGRVYQLITYQVIKMQTPRYGTVITIYGISKLKLSG